jgi:hypothetical protein
LFASPGFSKGVFFWTGEAFPEENMSEFTVNDRRVFSKDGSLNVDAEKKTVDSEPNAKEETKSEKSQREEPKAPPRVGADGPGGKDLYSEFPPSISSLFIGLATTALNYLGVNGPEDKSPSLMDLSQAKAYIDLLGLLEIKTKGNLDAEEEALIKALLYELRIKYVKLTKG